MGCTQSKANTRGVVRMLIAGPAGCGKTTIAKQMQIINVPDGREPFSDDQKLNYRDIIYNNIRNILLNIKIEKFNSEKTSDTGSSEAKSPRKNTARNSFTKETLRCLNFIHSSPTLDPRDLQVVAALKTVLSDRSFVALYARKLDPISYYIEHLSRIFSEEFIPNNDDILRARQRTSGVSTTTFHRDKYDWELHDVGGQINERKKWPEILQNKKVMAFLFCVSLGDIDATSSTASNNKPMLQDSIDLFEEMLSKDYTKEMTVILFLNKTDVFRKRLDMETLDLKNISDYTGQNDYEDGIKYFHQLFTGIAHRHEKEITIHDTCALDTSQARVVMESISRDIIRARLESSAL